MVATGASKAASARVGTCSSRGILCHYLPSAPRSSRARSSRASAAFALKRTSTIASRRGVSSATPTRAPGVVFAASGRSSEESDLPLNSVSVVLLAGGVGKRMGAPLPKQYIQLGGKEIALYSFEVFAGMDHVREIVVVCEEDYDELFKSVGISKPLKFARPGKERQDSCYNGFSLAEQDASLVAIHDSARPLLRAEDAVKCFEDAHAYGAAVLGVPVKSTIKEVGKEDGLVIRTPDRATLWEVQTPQVIKPDLLRRGFDKVKAESLEVTDDVSIIEQLGEPVRITTGDYYNIKLTTPEDLQLAESVLT